MMEIINNILRCNSNLYENNHDCCFCRNKSCNIFNGFSMCRMLKYHTKNNRIQIIFDIFNVDVTNTYYDNIEVLNRKAFLFKYKNKLFLIDRYTITAIYNLENNYLFIDNSFYSNSSIEYLNLLTKKLDYEKVFLLNFDGNIPFNGLFDNEYSFIKINNIKIYFKMNFNIYKKILNLFKAYYDHINVDNGKISVTVQKSIDGKSYLYNMDNNIFYLKNIQYKKTWNILKNYTVFEIFIN